MPKRLLALAVLPAVVGPLAGGFATAGHCNGEVRTISTIGGTLYIEDRAGELWVYLESNEVEGLQSGGRSVIGFHDWCGHENHDTLLF